MVERAKKKSEADIRREVAQRLEEIELQREDARQQGLAFASLTEEELTDKIQRVTSQSPYIYIVGWKTETVRGHSAYYRVTYSNPDPGFHSDVFVTMFFGLANPFPDVAQGWAGRDTRWPAISSRPVTIAAGATSTHEFTYVTPYVPVGTYLGNSVLWKSKMMDQGTYFDRGSFYVTLTES